MEQQEEIVSYNNSNSEEDYIYDHHSIDLKLFRKYYHNRSVSDTAFWILISSYSVLIIAGSLGNLFVILAVVKNKSKYIIF